ncbi:VOC family protein [Salinimonas chungwhensis]|uniref:VOC family protein n=1 Tax=Salinimonas chungwhensis TaxID=265425 RepID=UPI000374C399|nr:VOC family protein [Salinimonas chungwhensis]
MPQPFHLAIPVDDLTQAKTFYSQIMGCEQGRSDTQWIDWDFFGHQLVTHEVEKMPALAGENAVDSHAVPVPHFGVVLTMTQWRSLADRLRQANIVFVIEPYVRFEGQPGEQATMFFRDPAGNALEFKAFADPDQLFAS